MSLIEKNEPYYLKIYKIIKDRIFDGTYQPGEKLVESQLNREFEVSKSPVREAVRVLENEGLIVIKNSRLYVYESSVEDIKDVYAFRTAIESYTTKYFTIYAEDEEIEELETTLKKAEQLIQANASGNDIIQENINFHRIILNKSDNQLLIRHYNIINALINYYRNLNLKGEDRPTEILEQHREIFNLIKNRDATAASLQMTRHLEQDVEHLFEIMEIDESINSIL